MTWYGPKREPGDKVTAESQEATRGGGGQNDQSAERPADSGMNVWTSGAPRLEDFRGGGSPGVTYGHSVATLLLTTDDAGP